LDRRGFLQRIGRGGLGAAALAAPGGGFVAGQARSSQSLRGTLEARVATSGARGEARVWWSADTDERVVALTFDDGPTPDLTPRVLEVLARYDVVASFFAIGALVEQHPELLVRAHEAGHEVGNHTYHHVGAERMDRDEVLATVERGADAVADVLGHRPRWFRPVKGHVTGSVLRAAARVGHDLAIWSVSRGSRTTADTDVSAVRDHLTERVHAGAIVMLHDGVGRSALDPFGQSTRLERRRATELAALPEVVERWLAAGYRFVTLSELVDEHHRPSRTAPHGPVHPGGDTQASVAEGDAVVATVD
jgi:peptidoglycan/xylan/chitin deacetylase (PgdA/CDA1 family)